MSDDHDWLTGTSYLHGFIALEGKALVGSGIDRGNGLRPTIHLRNEERSCFRIMVLERCGVSGGNLPRSLNSITSLRLDTHTSARHYESSSLEIKVETFITFYKSIGEI
jgi:hypothetical protein